MNFVAMLGRLANDVTVRYTSGGTAVASFSLAVNRPYAKEGAQQADFLNIVAWGKTAEFCGKYFAKGLQIALTGRIQTRTWDDQDGKKRYATEIIAEQVYFAEGKKKDSDPPRKEDPYVGGEPDLFTPDDSDDVPF